MNDPYKVLNVSPSASDEEVKKAYRDLARKYHPDNYHDNPLADLAQEKMKEINAAYDEIITARRSAKHTGGTAGSSAGSAGSQRRYGATTQFGDVRKLIEVLQLLVDDGNTVLVIEHNLDVIKTADHLIDLGPEGGSGGGQIIATGTPEQVAANPASFTGQYLKPLL